MIVEHRRNVHRIGCWGCFCSCLLKVIVFLLSRTITNRLLVVALANRQCLSMEVISSWTLARSALQVAFVFSLPFRMRNQDNQLLFRLHFFHLLPVHLSLHEVIHLVLFWSLILANYDRHVEYTAVGIVEQLLVPLQSLEQRQSECIANVEVVRTLYFNWWQQ